MKENDFFLDTFNLVRTNIEKAKYRIKNKKFKPSERVLLQQFVEFKSNNTEDIIRKLSDINYDDYNIVSGCANWLKGLCYNQIGDFKESEKFLRKSLEILTEIDSHFAFYPCAHLVINLVNQNNKEEALLFLDLTNKHQPSDSFSQVLWYSAKLACLYIDNKDKNIIQMTDMLFGHFQNGFLPVHASVYLIRIMTEIKRENFEESLRLLEEYKKINSLKVKSNYKFLKVLLRHLLYRDEIYVYEREFNKERLLYLQLLTIKKLSLKHYSDAKDSWDSLHEIAPRMFQENFKFNGTKCVFSIALSKYPTSQSSDQVVVKELDVSKLNKIEQKIEHIINNVDSFISKDEIARLIWPDELPHQNYRNINKYIAKLRKKGYTLKIKNNSVYILDKNQAA